MFSEKGRNSGKALNTGIRSSELMSQTNKQTKMELLQVFEQERAWANAVLCKIPIIGVQVGLNRAKKARKEITNSRCLFELVFLPASRVASPAAEECLVIEWSRDAWGLEVAEHTTVMVDSFSVAA